LLDNSLKAGTYTVNLPTGAVATSIVKLTITPSGGNSITLLLPGGNTSATGLSVGDNTSATDDIILNGGGILKNSSGAGSGTPIAVSGTGNGTFRINNGGRYIHNTVRGATTGLADRLSTVAGTETGEFEYDIPGVASFTISTSGRTYGSLTLTRTAGAATYDSSGASALTIRANLTLNSGVTYSTTMTGGMSLAGNLISGGSVLTIPSSQAVTFNGTTQAISGASAVTFSGATTISAGSTTTVAANATLSIGSTLTDTGTLIVNGTLNCATNTVFGSGTFTLGLGGTLGIGSIDGITASGATGNIQTTTRNYDPPTHDANFTYNGTAPQNSGNGLPAIVGIFTDSIPVE
jgi:hypothetical protein